MSKQSKPDKLPEGWEPISLEWEPLSLDWEPLSLEPWEPMEEPGNLKPKEDG